MTDSLRARNLGTNCVVEGCRLVATDRAEMPFAGYTQAIPLCPTHIQAFQAGAELIVDLSHILHHLRRE